MKQRIRAKRSIGGFTLLEMLVVIIIIGILFAIAAPGWDTLLSRQRVSSAREQIAQTIRVAQSQARSTRSPRILAFDPSTTGKPRIAVGPYVPGTDLTTAANSLNANTWVLLGNGNVNSGTLRMATSSSNSAISALVFDSNGTVAQIPNVPAAQTLPFGITVARGNTTGTTTNRCVLVTTLLGTLRTDEKANCP